MYAVRRSQPEDVPELLKLAADDAFILKKRFGDPLNFRRLIETSFLCVTVTADDDRVVGFAALGDTPAAHTGIPADGWEAFLKCGWLSDKRLDAVHPCNAIWLNCLIVSATDEHTIAEEIYTTGFATLANIDWLLMPLSDEAPAFSPACDLMTPLTESGPVVDASNTTYHAAGFRGRVYCVSRGEVIPELLLRVGKVEDYDDLMPMLNGGEGIVTPLPDDLYLEELLQEQDDRRAVIVAEDRTTHRVVGLMCLRATYDEQQHVVKQYATDHFGKLKPMIPQTTHKGQQTGHNVVHISFFFLNPAYDNCSRQFVPRAFEAFPFAEYAIMFLPHAAPVHPVLHDFLYVPIKKLQPSNVQGERLPLPEGLYLVCRYALEPVAAARVDPSHEASVAKMMTAQSELSQDQAEATSMAFTQTVPVGPVDPAAMDPHAMQSLVLTWRDAVIGVAVVKRCTVEEMYALRANFDLAQFVHFDPDGDTNFNASDIAADPLDAPLTYHRDTVPGLVVKHLYVKPAFRCRLRFFLREVLRFCRGSMLLYPANADSEVYQPLVSELILAPPRRVPEFPLTGHEDGADDSGPDPGALMVLHFITGKLLSDEKTQINARIVVVGSGTTGLACIYSLLQIPYLHFSNIALISQDGMPEHPQQRQLLWTADSMEWSEREYLALRVGRKVRIIDGTMIDFDRADRYIYTDNATCEPYDHLILTVGRQYAMPKELIKQGAKSGVFPLANAAATARIRQHIHESEIYEDDRSRAVIYGSNLDVYAIAACVTQLDLGPQRIVLVSPEDASFNAFGDETIARKVDEMLDAIGVQRYTAHALERLELDEDKNLQSVAVAPTDRREGGKIVELEATMLIYADKKDIDTQVLSALNKRSIVFDGRVIVENCYRTTDRNIYAAGPVAMFSRRFGPCDDFDIFNTLEVGRHLCHTVLGFLGIDEFATADMAAEEAKDYVPKDDPLAAQLGTFKEAPPEDLARRRPKPLPQYTENVCRRVTLPTGLVFFTCYTVKYQKAENPDEYRHLTSWSPETNPIADGENQNDSVAAGVMRVDGEERCYVRVTVGKDGRIEAVAFLGRDPRSIENLRSLVGTAESTLNLVYNFDEAAASGKPLDILAYLESPWARAVFHDQFPRLAERIRERLRGHADVVKVREEMLRRIKASGERVLAAADRQEALGELAAEHCDVRHVVEEEVLRFLHEHKAFMPQRYFLPDANATLLSPATL
eukprot:CAMPEP_0174831894 /NCGR_PEP_ID=MMETSP1114-20130205/3369_1 /TAXON_ID=312471 /ORGANISM="Neobodo designis, Strain CCAP 1951/1" /LENGTH=1219 /DNA_ID=CAMNT_0016065741 /DNA_START=92 /DNA_END=3751 /DNA_ORIENTATION=-